ncbi:MAG TPA: DUF5715 family protein [Vicinamibacteria bacterium]|nr:DUF5715 family protein [Vicinamibacteria bacterium]
MRAIPAAASIAVVVIVGFMGCRRAPAPEANTGTVPEVIPAPSTAQPAGHTSVMATPSPEVLDEAIDRIEEERSSAGGVATPSELKHYPDTRRFLSLQIADAQEAALEIPHDDAELIEMIRAGKFVRLAPMTDTYLLYEIGEDAKDDPLIHYEVERNKDVPLLPSVEAIDRKKAELDGEGAKGRAQKAVLETYYGDAAGRETLFREYKEVASFAAENGYSLTNPEERARLHRDLLSYIRPEARDVLLKVADAYHRQFDRLLPVTSVVRTERYQRRLGGVNPNATRVEIAPHTTGEAFDVSYRYMAPDEQNFVMDLVAKLEDEQKVEALRENRGHIHIYAFAEGTRPPEARVEAARGFVDAARAERAEESRASKKARAARKAKRKPAAVKRTAAAHSRAPR